MTQTFKLYALARKRLEELLEKLSGQELFYIGGPEPLPSPLTHEEELALVARLAQDDGTIRATLIERNLRLVVFIAPAVREYRRRRWRISSPSEPSGSLRR